MKQNIFQDIENLSDIKEVWWKQWLIVGRKQIKAKGGPGSRQKNVGHEDVVNWNARN